MSVLDKVFLFLSHGRFYSSLPTPAANGAAVPFLTDAYGRLSVATQGPTPTGVTRSLGTNALVVKNSAGSLIELWGFSISSDGYVQVFNKTSAPVNGDVPVEVFPVKAGQVFSFSPGAPLAFATGISVGFSSTLATATIPITGANLCVTAVYL